MVVVWGSKEIVMDEAISQKVRNASFLALCLVVLMHIPCSNVPYSATWLLDAILGRGLCTMSLLSVASCSNRVVFPTLCHSLFGHIFCKYFFVDGVFGWIGITICAYLGSTGIIFALRNFSGRFYAIAFGGR